MNSVQADAANRSDASERNTGKRPLQSVWMLDMFAFTPWYTAALVRGLQRQGTVVRLVSGEFHREPAYLADFGLTADAGPLDVARRIGFGPLRRIARAGEAIWNLRALKEALHESGESRPEVIHLQQLPLLNHRCAADLRFIDAAQEAGIPVVHTVHNLLPHDSGDRLRRTYAELYKRVDHLVCHSSGTAQELTREFGIAPQRISVIPHGPLFEATQAPSRHEKNEARRLLGLPADRPIVLWQGVLAPYKGLDVLLEAWRLWMASFNGQGPMPLLLIAGGGPRKLEALVADGAARLPDSVRADLGYLPAAKIPAYFQAADLLVFPYHAVTTSGALLTGLSYRKPIIASNLPCFRDHLADGKNARLIPPGHAQALAAGFDNLLGRHGLELQSLAAGAADNRSRYQGWETVAHLTLELYRKLSPARDACRQA